MIEGRGGGSGWEKVLQWIQAWKEGQCITYQRKRIIRREVEREEGELEEKLRAYTLDDGGTSSEQRRPRSDTYVQDLHDAEDGVGAMAL